MADLFLRNGGNAWHSTWIRRSSWHDDKYIMTDFPKSLADYLASITSPSPNLHWVWIKVPTGICPLWYADELALEFFKHGIRTRRERTVYQDRVHIAFFDRAIAAQIPPV